MLLPSLVRLRHSTVHTETPEDIFSSTLGSIFTDDLQNLHGDDADAVIVYDHANHGELEVQTAKFTGEEQRRKFAHYLWNAGVLMAELVGGRPRFAAVPRQAERDAGWQPGQWWMDAVEEQHWSVAGERVLELGAGVGLGGIVSALAGATEVAITDYPAPPILDAIRINVAKNLPSNLRPYTTIQGHLWGSSSTVFETDHAHRFTRILAADCLWMPAEHDNLAQSMLHFLAESADARIYCIAGFHTGRAKVAPFFEEAVPQAGLEVEDIYEMDADGQRRSWAKERDGGREDVGERKKWLIVARIRRLEERPRCCLSAPTSRSTA